MPTLFRFLFVLGLIAGVVTGSLYVLAEYFQPQPKQISKFLRNVKVREAEESHPAGASNAPAPSTTGSVGVAGAGNVAGAGSVSGQSADRTP